MIILMILGLVIYLYWFDKRPTDIVDKKITEPTPLPTKIPLTNRCVKLPVLMYHHIENNKLAKKDNWQNLNVEPENFEKQMEYLKTNNYSVITMEDLINFFDKNISLPTKPVIITFDDAYKDNYINAFPILKEYGYAATIFTPTGLIQNPEYLTWQEIKEMSGSGLVYFGNHTWSHHSSTNSLQVMEKEIGLADSQLRENGQNRLGVFAYPYGKSSVQAKQVLSQMNYQLAFTTTYGNLSCKGNRLELPRIRVRNEPKLYLGL